MKNNASELLTSARLSCDSSGYYWSSKQRLRDLKTYLGKRGINYWADLGSLKENSREVTKCINPAAAHFEEMRWPCFIHAWHAINENTFLPPEFKAIK